MAEKDKALLRMEEPMMHLRGLLGAICLLADDAGCSAVHAVASSGLIHLDRLDALHSEASEKEA